MGLQLLLAFVETDAYYRGITASAHPNPSAVIPHFSLSHSSIPIVCPVLGKSCGSREAEEGNRALELMKKEMESRS